jgi:hypothetical protein
MTTSTLCRECGERFQVKPRAGRDFLLERRAPDGIECIVTNPPYRLADQFVEHGCEHLGRCAACRHLWSAMVGSAWSGDTRGRRQR